MTLSRIPSRNRNSHALALLAVVWVLATATTLQAQVISDPRVAEFDPSPDHFVILDSGEPAVVRYELEVYVAGAAVLVGRANMGKPSPEADGKIRFDFAAEVAAWSLPGGSYEARVSAIGPEGSAQSAPSNMFTFTTGATCSTALTAATLSVPALGGSFDVGVLTGASCEWTVTAGPPWVTIWVGGGTGNGSVPFAVQANGSTSGRDSTIEISGKALTIRQAGASAPPSLTFGKSSPANGVSAGGSSVSLTWAAVADAGYWVCWDTTNNNSCDGPWWPNGGGAGRVLTGLAPGTYYWQVRAQTASAVADANGGAWWSFTVGGSTTPPTAFGKTSPADGASGLASGLTLSWAAATGATAYQVCVDSTNDSACSTTWQSTGTATTLGRTGLAPGAYFWQVRAQTAGGTAVANGGTWWSFTVGGATTPPTAFGKTTPSNGAAGRSDAVTLTWSAVADAGYWVCWDTTNDNACDRTWSPSGGGTGRTLTGLAAGTYYWQVLAQTPSGTTSADGGRWWSFTVGDAAQPPSTFGKTSPASGASRSSSDVTLTWSAVADAGYWVCWDTSDNNTCDGAWWPNGGGTGRTLTGLAAGTYFWQIRAQTGSRTIDADGDAWWSFTVGGATQPPSTFGKRSPVNGVVAPGSSVMLAWGAAAGASAYEVCVDTTNDNACSTTWRAAWTSTSATLTGLVGGTYYWQVRALNSNGSTYGDGDTWWAVTVSATTAPFGKLAPVRAATDLAGTVTLTWSPLADAGYWVCWDTTDNNTCDGPWWPNGGGNARVLAGLPPGTYYWQVWAQHSGGTARADNGTWWSFTVR